MTDQQFEKLSALLDDEVISRDIENEINKLVKEPEIRGRWQRYQLIGDILRRETGPWIDPQLSDRISKSLEDEPAILAPAAIKKTPSKWLKPAAGIGVAASVALMAIMITPQISNNPELSNPSNSLVSQQPVQERIYVAEDGTRWELLQKPRVESRLNSYLVNHREYAPAGNMKGIMPYATFVSYDGGD